MSTTYLSDAELDAVTGGSFKFGSFNGNGSHNTTIVQKNTALVSDGNENVAVLALALQGGNNTSTVTQTIY